MPSLPLDQIAAVAVGGALGSVARFLASTFIALFAGTTFPWGTLFVNVAGSLWLGWIGALTLGKPGAIDPLLRLFLTTGFAGGFTTFSTFAFESVVLYQRGAVGLVVANVCANVLLSLIAVWLGFVIARLQGATL